MYVSLCAVMGSRGWPLPPVLTYPYIISVGVRLVTKVNEGDLRNEPARSVLWRGLSNLIPFRRHTGLVRTYKEGSPRRRQTPSLYNSLSSSFCWSCFARRHDSHHPTAHHYCGIRATSATLPPYL